MSKRNYCKQRKANHPSSSEDFHHLFFQRKHWQQGMAKVLREHPYCGGYIPQSTLHRAIHAKVHDVPTPNGSVCKHILNVLNQRLETGEISLDDNLDSKAQVLAQLLSERCPATAAILSWQGEIIAKFYGRY